MPEAAANVGMWLCGVIFAAGGFYFTVKRMRKDLNGVGLKLRSVDERADDRHLATAIAVMLITPPDKQHAIAQIFLNAGKGKSR